MGAWYTEVARQAKQANPSYLVSKATTATSSSTVDASPSAADACRHGAARGAVGGGRSDAAASRLPPKAAETNTDKATSWLARLPARDPSPFLLEGAAGAVGWRSPADGLQRASIGGPTPALSGEVIRSTVHLTGSGRLWMARERLLLLRCGDTSSIAAGAADGEGGVLDSLDADMAKARARGEEILAAVRGGRQGAKACQSTWYDRDAPEP
jgi:hypothetical protein